MDGNVDKQIILNAHIIVPEAPVPTKNIAINSPPKIPEIAIDVLFYKLLHPAIINMRAIEIE